MGSSVSARVAGAMQLGVNRARGLRRNALQLLLVRREHALGRARSSSTSSTATGIGRATLLAFSVGMKLTLIVTNVILGFAAPSSEG